MNADLDDDHGLTTALRDRMEGVRPDLDRLVAVATRQGTRIRRRTRLASLGGTLGVAAVIGAIAVGTSPGGGSSGARGEQPGFAGEPSSSPSASPSGSASFPFPSPTPTTAPAAPQTHRTPKGERSPVALDLPGWTCTPPADEKFICSSGGDSVGVNWRPADERHYWGNNPDKSADFISDVHGDFFVTVVVLAGTPSSAAVTVGQALTWTED